jgi:hypothetical protein
MTATNDPADLAVTRPDEPTEAQFGPHRFYPGEGGGSAEFRGAQFDAADLRGARFTDCDLTGVTIRDGWLVDVSISGYLRNVTVNGVDVTEFVGAELDRRHPERVQFREGQTADDVRAMWDTIERLWDHRAGRAAARGRAGRAGQPGMVIRADTAPSGLEPGPASAGCLSRRGRAAGHDPVGNDDHPVPRSRGLLSSRAARRAPIRRPR